MKLIILILLSLYTYSNSKLEQYQKAIKQYTLEYTVFGVDECLKKNIGNIAFDQSELKNSRKVLVGSKDYFNLLSQCFSDHISHCKRDCVTKISMDKRLENIQHLQKVIKKLSK